MIPLRQVPLAGVYPVPTGAFGIPWGRETEEERRKTYMGRWRPLAYRPAGRPKLGQENEQRTSYPLDPRFDINAVLLITNGTAIGYTILASLVYGKYKALDHVLLSVGALFYAIAALGSFSVPYDYRPRVVYSTVDRTYWDPVIGLIFGTLNSLVTVGAVAAAINPKLIARKTGMSEAIAKALPG